MKIVSPLISYVLCAAMFVLGCLAMTDNFRAQFNDTEENLASGATLLLDESLKPDTLAKMLTESGYVTDPVDASLVAGQITEQIKLHGAPENLGALNRRPYKMSAEEAYRKGGREMRSRVEQDFARLGLDADWHKAKAANPGSDFGNGAALITATVVNAKSIPDAPRSGILVRIREHRIDSTSTGRKSGRNNAIDNVVTLGYATTDGNGQARFHVEPGRSYSVIPIAQGYQYGQAKGTTATGRLGEGGLSLTFMQQPHVIAPLSSYTYQAIKADKAFIVRTPAQFLESLMAGAAIYLIGWLAFFLFMLVRDNRLRTRSDYMLPALLMALTGIGQLSMYAMTSPLSDKNYGYTMAGAIAVGLVAMALVSCINPSKYFAGKSLLQGGALPFDPIDSFMAKRRRKRSLDRTSGISFSTGFTYLLAAVALIMLLGMFGSGPEGSDARVNLGGFQPSEVCKYLILIFVASFFAENALLLQAFSSKLTTLSARRQVGTVATVVAVMLGLMMLYLLVLSDMGPALVALVTFILLYSMARRDFAQLLLGLLSFIGMMLLARHVHNTPVVLISTAAAWFIGWIAYGWFRSRQIYESAIIINLLIVIFSLGGPILSMMGAESEAARLTNRTAMAWGGQWDNHVPGGDQVAQGIWSAATGGPTGMGLGNGSPSVVPAFHTDMAFTSVGEMLGFTGLLLVTVCFVLLIHRSLLIGRKAAQPFTMYLVMGIALLTGVQFLFIVFGSLGIVPLSGVTVPFLSYSRTSLIALMAAFGIVISASRIKATESQLKYASTFTGAIAASVIMFMLGAFVILGALANYQIIEKDATLIRPAYITNTMGARIIEYNPRIGMVLNRLHAGNIYDTNGFLLATSVPDSLRNAMADAARMGISSAQLQGELQKRKARYYTLGDHTLFMLGDAGTKKVLGYTDADPIGFMAESRYAGELRGLDIPSQRVTLHSDEYRLSRFLPKSTTSFSPYKRDYSAILPFLAYGLYNNPLIEDFNENRRSRDLYLTIDASLQKRMQEALADYMHREHRNLDRLRASLVVLNATTGDLLTSSNYPLPQQDSIIMLNDAQIWGDAPFELIKGHAPITERDLGTTFFTPPGSTAKVMSALASFRGLGSKATEVIYNISTLQGIEGRAEPSGAVTMARAIPESSNNFFINIINDKNLYGQLGDVYEAVGVRLQDNAKENPFPIANTYVFTPGEAGTNNEFRASLESIGGRARNWYARISDPKRIGRTTNRDWGQFVLHLPWGQEPLKATPLTMARVASIVANQGKLAPTRYVKKIGDRTMPFAPQISIIDESDANTLKSYMQAESSRGGYMPVHPGDSRGMGGKTGTPERADRRGNHHVNDAWYICFLYSEKLRSPIAVALRMERTQSLTSGAAKRAMANCIIPTLNTAGYQIY